MRIRYFVAMVSLLGALSIPLSSSANCAPGESGCQQSAMPNPMAVYPWLANTLPQMNAMGAPQGIPQSWMNFQWMTMM